jgi:hypothetical protein
MSELTYLLQLGTKAIRLAFGDIVGDSKPICKSFQNFQVAHFIFHCTPLYSIVMIMKMNRN